MDKSFDPGSFETRWYAHWEANGLFKPSGDASKPAYSILLPPPNVTGTLHMGHAFQHTLMDTLIRYHRMKGFDTLWQLGTDHAGIATEMVVARNLHLAGQGETRDGLGREAFVEKVWEWKQESGDTIERQMRRMGSSGDWSRSVFTMDAMPSRAVIETFVRLYENKDQNGNHAPLIYRGQKLVNWDPVLKTAISDLEVVSEEENGHLWSIRYPLVDATYEHVERDVDGIETLCESRDYLVVATTRPETMLGDVAVMVHPEDERYAHLVGKRVRLPLCEREIPVIADDYVDRSFGTGVVKVTPAHDFNDYAVGQRHGLPLINLFTATAHLNDAAPERFRGLDRFEARKVVLAELESLELLLEAKPHKLMVPRGDRTGQVIEPYLTDQWFVKMDEFAKQGLAAVESGRVRFVPPNWINTYRHWLENIQDWCISRQLWWGHRIPAWYDEAGRVYVGRDEAEVRATHGLGANVALRQDSDVLETWFSSAIWPHSTMGWPDAQAMAARGFDRYLPSSVLVTGFDILFFWVARMVMMTGHFTGEMPFKDVYITGLVRDKDGQKMSKSKGNVLDPIDLIDGISIEALVAKRISGLLKPSDAPKIEKATRREFPDGIPAFGTDALRFTFASLATHGRDIKFDLARCEGYKNFCNKLWNAARFVLMNTEGFSASGVPSPTTDAERWILDRLQQLLKEVDAQFAAYRFDLASQAMYEFVWNEVCDWFLELAKPALQGEDAAAIASTRHTLLYVLEQSLRVLHPLIPFVTEEIWSHVAPKLGLVGSAASASDTATSSISVQAYPAFDAALTDARATADIEWLKTAITALRSIRSQLGVPPGKAVPLLLSARTEAAQGDAAAADRARLQRHAAALSFLARLESIDWVQGEPPAAAAAVLGGLTLLVPLAGLVDLDAERARLDKEIQRVEGEILKCHAKLGSDTFVANAPEAVVAQERKRLAEWTSLLAGLKLNKTRL